MITLLLMQLSSVNNTSPTTTEVPLWRDFKVGMNPEQAAEIMRSLEGVQSAVVNRSKKGKFKSIDVKYKGIGVTVGSDQMDLTPTFDDDDRLTEISLSSSACSSIAIERMKLIREALAEKYDHFATEKVVDENGVEIEKRGAFWNDATRVRLSLSLNIPTRDYIANPGGRTANALASLANALNQQAYAAAVSACPNDNGATITYTLSYSSQAQFVLTHDAEVKAREEEAKAVRDSL